MKVRSKRLKVVLELAERNESAALEILTNKRRYRDEQVGQLDGLKSYHEQYMQDMKNSMVGVQDVARLQANLLFIEQVNSAIKQQEAVTQVAQQEFDLALQNWTALHQKKKGMADLIDRYRNEELVQLEKKNQMQIEDELLARKYRR